MRCFPILVAAVVAVSPAGASVSLRVPTYVSLRPAAAPAPSSPAPGTSPAAPSPAPSPASTGAAQPAAITTADGRTLLAYRGKSGAVARYENGGSITVNVNGMKMTLDVKETDKSTIVTADTGGNVVMKHETESTETSMDGHVMPASEGSKDSETVTIRPDGSLVSFTSTSSDKDSGKTDARLFVATQPVFPASPLAISEKWSRDFAADSTMGLRKAHGDYQLLAAEKVDGIDTVKVHVDYHETEGPDPISAVGTLSIERSSGDSVADEFEITNLPFPGGPPGAAATAKLHSKRIAGGPLTGTPADLVKTDPNRIKSVDEVVKDYQKIPGLFTLYRKTEAGRDSVYMEIREDQLDKLMLLEVTASTGTGSQIVAGDPINDILFKLTRRGDQQILLVAPNYKYTVHNNPALERAIHRSFADSYLDSFKVEAAQPDRKTLLIDVTDLFQGNLAEITDHLSSGSIMSLFGGGGGYGIDREKTYIRSIKCFPENVVVQTAYNFTGRGSAGGAMGGGDTLADSRSMPVLVDYTVFELKDTGYRPRLADPRVGYFTNGMMW
ncbi:MAG: DUF5117 domain-containing protein, partial [Chloroflexi bacterium]|nr:DUF5117 domain-containing protein [Chloroflexota bacterium]